MSQLHIIRAGEREIERIFSGSLMSPKAVEKEAVSASSVKVRATSGMGKGRRGEETFKYLNIFFKLWEPELHAAL